MQRILLLDDEPDILNLFLLTVKRMGLEATTAKTIADAKEALANQSFALCLTDMRLPDGSGMDLIKYMQKHHRRTPVVMITAYGTMDVAIDAMKLGAFDFLSKPVELDKLRSIIENAIILSEDAESELTDPTPASTGIIGDSPAIKRLHKQIGKVGRSHAPVFIYGESGTGKELVARAIHSLGPRREKPFITVNCGAIPSELMESEFFGHVRGAFTGANTAKEGFFQAANGGTLFLDEVADLPLAMQVKLLRAIQENVVRPVGSETEHKVDVRILSASHKDLQALVTDNQFREDLFYRLDVIRLEVPPLRERSEDIPAIAKHILKRQLEELGLASMTLGSEALSALQQHTFPGNVRELENLLQRAITLSENQTITAEDLALTATNKKVIDSGEAQPSMAQNTPNTVANSHSLPAGMTLEDYLEDIETQLIQQALEDCRWNKTAAAEQLGMSFRSLRYRLKKLNID
ncbi:sigma-54-dependent Fis family transcriptional regulator [Bermanella marisrubri]|uniref:Two-component response regulator PilR n=1 Tax=Bermanella marisrubri TaxID=207949 RepID=Q1MYR4_9GAMM|nr:sigma-54 dependent transcriptional regulator [Bermanella marisrubri]EAT11142.1 two-component response regulator PilR [Oceanobacter sp. RED65] [Bermanella marisrubri]QIZ83463.1 sigma-54-dependent Fis family transcriptional regulator [Bermanella marisrubri]